MNPPDIAGFVERYAYHPPLSSGTARHAVSDAGRHTFAAGQFVERDCEAWFQRARKPYAATLRIEHERVSGFGEWRCRFQTGDAERNLGADTSTLPSRFRRFFGGIHSESFLLILRSIRRLRSRHRARDVHQSNSGGSALSPFQG